MRRIVRWNPGRDLMTLREAMDRLVEDSFVRPTWQSEHVNRLPIDVYSTSDELVITASVPGIDAQEVDISIEGETIYIKVEYKEPLENVDYIFQERATGTFERRLTLNVPVQADKAEATFENGVLTLTLPKAEEIKPRVIKVKTK